MSSETFNSSCQEKQHPETQSLLTSKDLNQRLKEEEEVDSLQEEVIEVDLEAEEETEEEVHQEEVAVVDLRQEAEVHSAVEYFDKLN